jgi:phospho-N-acetylmuramoyl-pentapeptide-transferase
VLNVTQYHVPHGGGELVGAGDQVSFWVEALMGLRGFQIGQVIRTDGPTTHKPKAGTPTMGGLLILTATLVPTLLWARLSNVYVWIAVLTTAAFGAVGFADDYLKIVRRSHHGLRPRYKLLCQLLIGSAFGATLIVLAQQNLYNTQLVFPFFKRLNPNLGWVYLPSRCLFSWPSRTPSISPTVSTAYQRGGHRGAAFTALTYVVGNRALADYLLLAHFPQMAELTIFCGSLVGASLGFLWHNSYPAEIFMGDVAHLPSALRSGRSPSSSSRSCSW